MSHFTQRLLFVFSDMIVCIFKKLQIAQSVDVHTGSGAGVRFPEGAGASVFAAMASRLALGPTQIPV